MAKQIIFVDTNIIIPQVAWDLYRLNLNQYKESGTHLTDNIKIDEGRLEQALRETQAVLDLLDHTDGMSVTKGVYKQASFKINDIRDNVHRRRANYIFTEFSRIISEPLKEKNRNIYSQLVEYHGVLGELEDLIRRRGYSTPSDESYFLLANFVRALNDRFFDITKEDHKFDFNTDEYIVVACLFESIVNSADVHVYSNDSDVMGLLGISCAVFEKVAPLMRTHAHFRNFYDHMPQLFSLRPQSPEPVETDYLVRGRDLVKYLSGFEDTSYLEKAQMREYQSKLTSFTNFLDKSIFELIELID